MKRRLSHRHIDERPGEDTGSRQSSTAKGRRLRGNSPYQYLYLGLLASGIVRKYISVVWVTRSGVLCYCSPSKPIQLGWNLERGLKRIRILVVQWLGLCAPSAGSSGSIPARGNRPHMLQLNSRWAAAKDSTCRSEEQRSRVLQLCPGTAKKKIIIRIL